MSIFALFSVLKT